MNNAEKLFDERLLCEILSQPSAPFREMHVIKRILREFDDTGVPYFTDPIGNIVVGVDSKANYQKLLRKKSSAPLQIFIAHLDHPGFHGVKWKTKAELEIQWHGGSPTQHLNGSKVWLADPSGFLGFGILQNSELHASGRMLSTATVQVEKNAFLSPWSSKSSAAIFGGFGFRAPVWKEGELIYTKAADDLVGVFAIASLAIQHFGQSSVPGKTGKKKAKRKLREVPFIGLLTRAEEVGFIGAIGHFELGWLKSAKRKILCVSLETSRTLPGAEIGKGPVVRLGDRYTVFEAGYIRILSDIAQARLPDKHQRRIMDGGTCEATAATVYGFPAIGISIPLGNYHNQSFEGGPDAAPFNGPAPEFVHRQDIIGLLELCEGLVQAKANWDSPWKMKRKELKESLKKYKKLL